MDKVQEFRRPYQERAERLATLMGRPFADAYKVRLADMPVGTLAFFFYGNDRVGLVEHDGDGNYHSFPTGGAGKTEAVMEQMAFAITVLEAMQREG